MDCDLPGNPERPTRRRARSRVAATPKTHTGGAAPWERTADSVVRRRRAAIPRTPDPRPTRRAAHRKSAYSARTQRSSSAASSA
eukprot:2645528-Prymnesium_polylepis.1